MKVGIIGAGTMGSGIAQAFAQTEGYEVFLCDINEEFAANGSRPSKSCRTSARRTASSQPTLLPFPSRKSEQAWTDP